MNVRRPGSTKQPPVVKFTYDHAGVPVGVEIDGQRINGMRHFSLQDGHDQATEVTLTFLASKVEIENLPPSSDASPAA